MSDVPKIDRNAKQLAELEAKSTGTGWVVFIAIGAITFLGSLYQLGEKLKAKHERERQNDHRI